MAVDADQRSRLLLAKLRGLAGACDGLAVDPAVATPAAFPGGAALLTDDRAAVYVEDQPERALGAALAWSYQRAAPELDVIVDEHEDVLARRAACFARPEVPDAFSTSTAALAGVNSDATRCLRAGRGSSRYAPSRPRISSTSA